MGGDTSYNYSANQVPYISFDSNSKGFYFFKMNGVTITYHFYDNNDKEITFDHGTAYLEAASLNHDTDVTSQYPTTRTVPDHIEKIAPILNAKSYPLIGSKLTYHDTDTDDVLGNQYNGALYSDIADGETDSNGVMEIQNGSSLRYYLPKNDSEPSAWFWSLGTDIPDSRLYITKTVNETIHYQTKDGTELAPDHTSKAINLYGYAKTDGSIIWDSADLPSVTSPQVQGYTASDSSIPTIHVINTKDVSKDSGVKLSAGQTNANTTNVILTDYGDTAPTTTGPTIERTVTYTPDAQKLTVTYIDDTTGQTLKAVSKNGVSDGDSGYNATADITNYENDGYTLVSDGTIKDTTINGNLQFDHDDSIDQSYEVHLKHTVKQVTPATPPTESNGVDPTQLIKNVKETITYTGMDSGNPGPKSHTLSFVGSGYYDSVTKKWTDKDGKELKDASGNDVTADNGGITWISGSGTTFDAVTTPNESANGYYIKSVSSNEDPAHPGSVAAITGINHKSNDINITVTYAHQGSVTVNFHDQSGDPQDLSSYQLTTGTQHSGDPVTTQITTGTTKTNKTMDQVLTTLENMGYKLVGTKPSIPTTIGKSNQTFDVYLTHDTVTVTPNKPGTPGTPLNPSDPRPKPDQPKYPSDSDKLTKTITRKINYTGDGLNIPSQTQKLNFSGSGTIDKVTGKYVTVAADGTITPLADQSKGITWTADGKSTDSADFAAVNAPTGTTGYVINRSGITTTGEDASDVNELGGVKAKDGITHGDDNITITIPFVKNTQNAQVIYRDVNDATHPVTIPGTGSGTLTGDPDTAINYSTADTIADLEKKGYVLVNNGFDPNGTAPNYDSDRSTDQTYYVTLKHKIVPVTPGTPTDQSNGITPSTLTNTVTETVHYSGAGSATPADHTQALSFTGTAYYDAVTKKWTDANGNELADQTKNVTWKVNGGNQDNGTFATVTTPLIQGYTSKVQDGYDDGNGNVDSITNISHDHGDVVVNVKYTKGASTIPAQGNVQVIFHDDTTNTTIPGVGTQTGNQNVGTSIDYTPTTDQKKLTDEGYVYVKTDGTIPGQITKGSTVVTIHMKHGTQPVDPDHPGTPNTPINPSDPRPTPDQPKYPSGTDPQSLTKTVTRTIHYTGAGSQTPADVTQSATFTANGEIDKVTGEWTKPLTWTPAKSLDAVTTPTIAGYHVVNINRDKDGNNVAKVTTDHNGSDYTVTVTYAPNGETVTGIKDVPTQQTIHYVDDQGHTIYADNSQTANFHYSGDTVDSTTGEVKSTGSWNENSHTFTTTDVPVIDGYVAVSGFTRDGNKVVVKGQTTTTDNPNATVTVVYKKVGKIVPVESDGHTPVPSAPTPSYPNDPSDPTKVQPNEPVPSIKDWTPQTPTVTPTDPTKDTPVPYTQQGQVKVIFHDDTTNTNIPGVGTDTGKQTVGTDVTYTPTTDQTKLENEGYKFVRSDGTVPTKVSHGTTTVIIHMIHDTQPVNPTTPGTPGSPINPKDPTGPKYPDKTDKDSLTKTITRTIHYTGAGSQTPKDVTQTLTFNQKGVLDKVTGQWITPLTWTLKDGKADSGDFGAVDAPTITGYVVDTANIKTDNEPATYVNTLGGVKAKNGINHHGKNITITIPFVKNTQNAKVIYQDVNDSAHPTNLTDSGSLTGDPDTPINYSTADTITKLEKQGYVLVNNGFDPNGSAPDYDSDRSTNQTYYVTLKHKVVPVTPKTPTDQSNGITPSTLTKTVKETVHYSGAENQTPADHTQTLTFTGTAYYDAVTKKWTDQDGNELTDQTKNVTWKLDGGEQDNGTFTTVTTPIVAGYTSKVQDGYDDGNGNVDTISNISHDHDNVLVNVKYTKNEEPMPDQGNVQVVFHDDTTNTTIPGVGTQTGNQNVDTPVNYTPTTDQKKLTDEGYVYVKTDGTIPGKITKGNTVVTIHMKHCTQPIDPSHPGTPNTPINPSDPRPTPEQPTYPTGTDQKSLTKTVTRTIHYIGAGRQTPRDVTQSVTFTAKGEIDKVTGQWTTPLTWTPAKSLDGVTTPTIAGYHVVNVNRDKDGNNVAKVTTDHNGSNYTVDVTYAPVGETVTGIKDVPTQQVVHYVDDQGHTIHPDNTQTANFHYSGDTVDSKTGEVKSTGSWNETSHTFTTTDVPVIPGYVAVSGFTKDGNKVVVKGQTTTTKQPQTTVTVVYKKVGRIIPVEPDGHTPIPGVPTPSYPNDPTDPTKVTPNETVPTIKDRTPQTPSVTPTDPTKDTPVPYTQQGQVKVVFHDDTTNTNIPGVGTDTGKQTVGTNVTYNPTTDQKKLTDKGYVFVRTDGNVPTKVGHGTTTVIIHMKHGLQPVDSTQPGTPNNPINPNDPTGPKYPGGTDSKSLTKTVTRTIHYTGAGNNTPKDVTQTVTFTQTGVLDKVTGKWTTPLTWSNPQTVDSVTTPSIDGYHVVKVSRDQDGNNVAKTTINHDGSDYTVDVTYEADGHTVQNVKDVPTQQVVHYVDDQGHTIHPDNTQTATFHYSGDTVDTYTGKITTPGTWNETSHTFTTTDVPVIPGYVAVSGFTKDGNKVVVQGQTTTTDQPQTSVTVVYKKVGRIVPVEPDGKTPIANVPTPSYPNDPNDPTKVQPNESVPTIKGRTPQTTTVTPKDPTKDTPVPYDYQGQVKVVFHDDTTNTDIPGVGTDTGIQTVGTAVTYTPTTDQKKLTDEGYVLVKTDGTIPTKITKGNTVVTIHMKHGEVTINPTDPNNPDQPGKPINPNDPRPTKDQPTYPTESLTSTVTRTIHYVYPDGRQARPDRVDHVTFNKTIVIDKVTGQVLHESWDGPKDFTEVVTPTIAGYTPDKTSINGSSVQNGDPDITETVTYTAVPVTPTTPTTPGQPAQPTVPTTPSQSTTTSQTQTATSTQPASTTPSQSVAPAQPASSATSNHASGQAEKKLPQTGNDSRRSGILGLLTLGLTGLLGLTDRRKKNN